MKKIIVIGSGGAGKSTFSKHLGAILAIEVIHLDQLYWKPGWVKTETPEWEAIVADRLAGDAWVMDGNFGGTREMRLRACDTVIFLDIPRRVCLYRILKRAIVYRGKVRPDMSPGCPERFDLEFVLWVWNYPRSARERVIRQLAELRDKNIIVLRSTGQMRELLNGLSENGPGDKGVG